MGALMGFTEVKDDDGNPRWKCSGCPMQDRKLTGFSLVKHIQGKKHLEKHLTDQNSNQKDEILAVRWRLHQLLEDRKFFCQQIGLNPPMPDFNMEAIVRAEMQNDHDEIDGLEGGNNFALHGVQRLSDDCFLYRCQHCPEARITDPSKAFQHMTQNKFHAANLKRIKDARNASVADGESTDHDMDATGSGMASNLARRSASVDLGNSFAVREYGEKQTKKGKPIPEGMTAIRMLHRRCRVQSCKSPITAETIKPLANRLGCQVPDQPPNWNQLGSTVKLPIHR
jgi:hypothetical protein